MHDLITYLHLQHLKMTLSWPWYRDLLTSVDRCAMLFSVLCRIRCFVRCLSDFSVSRLFRNFTVWAPRVDWAYTVYEHVIKVYFALESYQLKHDPKDYMEKRNARFKVESPAKTHTCLFWFFFDKETFLTYLKVSRSLSITKWFEI